MIDENKKSYKDYYNENIINNSRDELNDYYNRNLDEMIEQPSIDFDNDLSKLINDVYNPKQEEVRRDKYERLNEMSDLGAKFLDSETDKDSFNEFMENNHEFLDNMNYIKNNKRYDLIENALNKTSDKFKSDDGERGKLLPLNGGYAIELSNGDIIYTDKISDKIRKEEEKREKLKQKEHDENQKLLEKEYNDLIKRQERGEKARDEERIKELKEKERDEKIRREFINKMMLGFITGISGSSIINKIGRRIL